MTCQACQTWNGEDDHRCRRCGRRLRATPTRHVRESYPIAATALAYQQQEFLEAETDLAPEGKTLSETGGQQILFSSPNEPRVIPFDQLTSPAERESIRIRGAQLNRTGPVPSAKMEVSPRRPRRAPEEREEREQQRFDFFGKADIASPPRSPILCGAAVAPPMLRLNAALVDGFIVLAGAFLFASTLRVAMGPLPTGKIAYPVYLACLLALSLTYKLIWCVANTDSFGTKTARLRLVDLDGNPPAQRRRFSRALSSFLSLGAVGLGLIWMFADADGLAWHDQISSTFPTFSED